MKVVIAGGTGFLGRPLSEALLKDGHQVTLLSRSEKHSPDLPLDIVRWTPNGQSGPWAEALEGSNAVVNLAGESIADGRWTAERKRLILESRVLATRSLVSAFSESRRPPRLLVNGSAVGYYGPLGDEFVTEEHPPGGDFLSHVCQAWETEARAASRHGRVVLIRTGLVLDRGGGALEKMLTPFRLGLGGPVGSGRQYWPWIHRTDWVNLVRWTMKTTMIEGPVNATALYPTTSAEFAQTLGRVLHRPAFLTAPSAAMRLVFGEMADALLLSGQRAVPAKAVRLGFPFAFENLSSALQEIFA